MDLRLQPLSRLVFLFLANGSWTLATRDLHAHLSTCLPECQRIMKACKGGRCTSAVHRHHRSVQKQSATRGQVPLNKSRPAQCYWDFRSGAALLAVTNMTEGGGSFEREGRRSRRKCLLGVARMRGAAVQTGRWRQPRERPSN